MFIMTKLIMDKQLKVALDDKLKKMDDELREIEEIQKEMDNMLYDIERRVARLRRSGRA